MLAKMMKDPSCSCNAIWQLCGFESHDFDLSPISADFRLDKIKNNSALSFDFNTNDSSLYLVLDVAVHGHRLNP